MDQPKMIDKIQIDSLGGITFFDEKGKIHRLKGPADETKRLEEFSWRYNGYKHRLNGPAIEHVNGSKEWWLNDKEYKLERNYWKAVTKLKGKVI